MNMFELTRLPCGAVIRQGPQDGSQYYPKRYVYLTISEGQHFARTLYGNWSCDLELIIQRDGLPALRDLIDQLIKEPVKVSE
jgi:beta-lactam-binding protein with PASTA domain